MRKKLLTLLLAVAASIGTLFAWDYERVQIGDLYYNLNASSQTAEVTSQNSSNPYWSTTITTANIPSSVTYNSVSYSVTSIGGYAFLKCTGLTSVTIPNSVTEIGDWAFYWCSGLTSVTIPNSVTSIGSYAFERCSGLTSIEIPNSVTSIGEGAFYNCTGLTSIEIPNSVTSIGEEAFAYCTGLTSVTIPNSVTEIGDYAFAYCTGLTSITCEAVNLPSLGNLVFYNVPKDIPLYVPDGKESAYNGADQWKEFDIKPISAIPTGINQTSQEPIANSQKLLINGQILILRGEKVYTLQGQEVK